MGPKPTYAFFSGPPNPPIKKGVQGASERAHLERSQSYSSFLRTNAMPNCPFSKFRQSKQGSTFWPEGGLEDRVHYPQQICIDELRILMAHTLASMCCLNICRHSCIAASSCARADAGLEAKMGILSRCWGQQVEPIEASPLPPARSRKQHSGGAAGTKGWSPGALVAAHQHLFRRWRSTKKDIRDIVYVCMPADLPEACRIPQRG